MATCSLRCIFPRRFFPLVRSLSFRIKCYVAPRRNVKKASKDSFSSLAGRSNDAWNAIISNLNSSSVHILHERGPYSEQWAVEYEVQIFLFWKHSTRESNRNARKKAAWKCAEVFFLARGKIWFFSLFSLQVLKWVMCIGEASFVLRIDGRNFPIVFPPLEMKKVGILLQKKTHVQQEKFNGFSPEYCVDKLSKRHV